MEFLILYNSELQKDSYLYPLECDFLDEQVVLMFFSDSKYTLKDILKKENIDFCFEKEKEFLENDEYTDDITKVVLLKMYEKKYKKMIKSLDNLHDIEYTIKLDNIDDIDYINNFKTFIRNNNFLEKCKVKVRISENFDLSNGSYEKAKKIFKDFENISFYIDGNDNAISLNEFKNTIIKIDELVENVKKYNFSPFEQLLYTYDIVRNRVYKNESTNEDNSTSRDLTSVLFGNSIVCLGYARVYDAILKKLGINSRVVYLYPKDENKKNGHARNVCYVKDDKYGIDGIYYFDPTWDSKRDENDKTYLNRYNYFCKSKVHFNEICYIDSSFGLFESNNNYKIINKNKILTEIEKIKKTNLSNINLFELIRYKDDPNLIDMDVASFINHILQFTNNDKFLICGILKHYSLEYLNKLNNSKDKIINQMNKCIELYYPIDIDESTFFEALYNVRKIQYYNASDSYILDEKNLKKTTIGYVINCDVLNKIKCKNKLDSSDLVEIFKLKLAKNILKDKYKNENYDNKISEVKFTKVLSKILEKKKN